MAVNPVLPLFLAWFGASVAKHRVKIRTKTSFQQRDNQQINSLLMMF